MYKEYDIETQIGGPVIEIARLQGSGRAALEYLVDMGFDTVRPAQSHAHSTRPGRRSGIVSLCVQLGLRVHGEVGKKFPEGDKPQECL